MKYQSYAKFLLRRHMEKNNLSPQEGLLVDGERHCFTADRYGKNGEAFYLATIDDFGNDCETLTCNYGWTDSKKTYDFTY